MPRGRMGGRHGMSTEKAKDFKGTMKKLMGYLAQYKIGLLLVVIFAIGSTIFNIAGPKILGKATTELFHGLISKVSGGSGIDFDKIAKILIGLMCLYVCSALFSFIQGYIMTGVSQKLTYRMRKEISEKIDRLPMGYFDKMTHGEILSRITNDVDTLSQSLNQSATQVHWSTGHDAQHQSAYDSDRNFNPSTFHGADRNDREAFPEIFQGTAGVSWIC